MKKIGIAIISIVSILALSSCATKHNGPFLSATPGDPSITAPSGGGSYVLTKATANDTAFTMKWTAPNYGYPAAVTYTIQLDNPGDNFANPIQIGKANLPTFSAVQGDLNNVLTANGFIPGVAYPVQVRVMASVSDSLKAQVSQPISMTLTPYSSYRQIFVPGNYQATSGYGSAWTPPDAPPLSMTGNLTFEGYVYIYDKTDSDIQFKFTNDQTWTLAWGQGPTPGTLSSTGGNITMPTDSSGYYKINVDLGNMTYTMLKTTWSIIGDATPGGWGADTPMTYDPTTKEWSVTVALTTGGLKFRANDSWDLNYGDTGANGILNEGGDNINVTSGGTYKVILNLSNPPLYTYKLIKQ